MYNMCFPLLLHIVPVTYMFLNSEDVNTTVYHNGKLWYSRYITKPQTFSTTNVTPAAHATYMTKGKYRG